MLKFLSCIANYCSYLCKPHALGNCFSKNGHIKFVEYMESQNVSPITNLNLKLQHKLKFLKFQETDYGIHTINLIVLCIYMYSLAVCTCNVFYDCAKLYTFGFTILESIILYNIIIYNSLCNTVILYE